ncbi:MAG: hypothetical protein AB1453_07240 [Chloroflexota bacterium]|jgi:hypothetical protein
MFKPLLRTSAFVHSFHLDEQLTLLCDNHIQVYDPATLEKTSQARLFEKDGLARSLTVGAEHIYCSDFIHLYILDKHSLQTVARLRLGEDLRSDICAAVVEEGGYVYAAMRNGAVARIPRCNWQPVEYFPLSTTSSWAMIAAPGSLFAGTVAGQLLILDTATMSVERQIHAHRQNLKSLHLSGGVIATAGQDKALALWDWRSGECRQLRKNTHRKAFMIIGEWRDYLLTASFACGEIKLWDRASLAEKAVLPIQPCLTGHAQIVGSSLFLASREICGIDWLALDEVM